MPRQLFIYWKIDRVQAQPAQQAAAALLAALRRAHPGLEASLMRRADDSGEQLTFMETYRRADGVSAALQQHIADEAGRAYAALGSPARHVEVFETLAG